MSRLPGPSPICHVVYIYAAFWKRVIGSVHARSVSLHFPSVQRQAGSSAPRKTSLPPVSPARHASFDYKNYRLRGLYTDEASSQLLWKDMAGDQGRHEMDAMSTILTHLPMCLSSPSSSEHRLNPFFLHLLECMLLHQSHCMCKIKELFVVFTVMDGQAKQVANKGWARSVSNDFP